MRDTQFYDMGERGYVAAMAQEVGLPLGTRVCERAGCAAPEQKGACDIATCPRKGDDHG